MPADGNGWHHGRPAVMAGDGNADKMLMVTGDDNSGRPEAVVINSNAVWYVLYNNAFGTRFK